MCTVVTTDDFWIVNGIPFNETYGRGFKLHIIIFAGLGGIGISSILLFFSGFGVIRYPKSKYFKFFSAFFSCILSIPLMYVGNYSLWTAQNIERQIEEYCLGGFPQMTDLSSNTVIELQRAENHLIDRYMCNGQYCPCSITIDP